MAWGGEDALDVGEDVVGGEEDRLAAAPENLAEEIVRVEGIGEGDGDHLDADGVTKHVELVHHRRARWEVGKAGVEEVAGEPFGPPPPRRCPHTERGLHLDARRVEPLRHGRRPLEGCSVVHHLHGGGCTGAWGSGRGLSALVWVGEEEGVRCA